MLEHLKLTDVGPAPEMEIDFSPRLNFLTGDNGLGKTFLLDIAWWALTRTWAGPPAAAHRGPDKEPSIEYQYGATKGPYGAVSVYDRQDQEWPPQVGRPPIPGMVIYARVDGSFSAWDPARNYWRKRAPEGAERPASFVFQADEVWQGLPREPGRKLCNGLIADWASWQREDGEAFRQLKAVLRALSPSEGEPLVPGKLARIALDDVRDYPTLLMPYGQEVALVHASAGMRRIVALAYLIVWTWQEHLKASELLATKPAREIIFLIDEVEAHLHPQWQRCVVPALLQVMEALTGDRDVPVQLIAATHSPLVLASAEPAFDPERDAVFHLDLRERVVSLEQIEWAKQGDVTGWLVSEVFGLQQARSIEAERAIEAAEAWMRGDTACLPEHLESQESIHAELLRVLAGHDPFWPRWIVHHEKEVGSEG